MASSPALLSMPVPLVSSKEAVVEHLCLTTATTVDPTKTAASRFSQAACNAFLSSSSNSIPPLLLPPPPPNPSSSSGATLLENTNAKPARLSHLLPADTAKDSNLSKKETKEEDAHNKELPKKEVKQSLRQILGVDVMGSTQHLQRLVPKVVGHRGALYDCLENTRDAFRRCVDLGCQGIELDVFVIKDGSLVVFHGGGSDQVPGGLKDHVLNAPPRAVSILDLTYEECCQLEFNPDFQEFPCPKSAICQGRVPLLQDVLTDLKGTGVQVKIELKGPNTVLPVLEVVERLDMVSQCCYGSFQHKLLQELRTLRPDATRYPTGALFVAPVPSNYLALAQDCGATEVHLPYHETTVQRVCEIHQAGLTSMAWFPGPLRMQREAAEEYWDIGNEDVDCYRAVMDTGVEQVCVNRPGLALQMVQQQQQQQRNGMGAEPKQHPKQEATLERATIPQLPQPTKRNLAVLV